MERVEGFPSAVKGLEMSIKLTRDIAWAAATDAGNLSMRRAGRTGWSKDDYQEAVDMFHRFWPEEREIEEARRAYNAAIAKGATQT